MTIIGHRGWWTRRSERNRPVAFLRSLASGYGIVADVRDVAGSLVISHDLPLGDELPFEDFAELIGGADVPVALKIKSDGLIVDVADAIHRYALMTTFVFDMSVPDMQTYFAAGVPVFGRLSEFEPELPQRDHCDGVIVDSFRTDWFDGPFLERLLEHHQVCVVSPELHGRDPERVWDIVADLGRRPGLMLCTDRPRDAQEHGVR